MPHSVDATSAAELALVTEHNDAPSHGDPDFRRMMKWVAIALVVTVALALVAVELTLRWFGVEP